MPQGYRNVDGTKLGFQKGYIPWNKGIHQWEDKEHPKGMLGKHHSVKTKQKMKGCISWNKGLKGEELLQYYKKGYPKGMLGKRHTKKAKNKMSLIGIGRKISEVTKEKIRNSNYHKNHKGKNSSRYGKPPPHGKGTYYKGIWMRSGWEVRIAQLADQAGIKWQYEPKRFYFKDCTYTPDFYWPKWNLWVEVKGWMGPESKKRISQFQELYPQENLLVIDKFLYKKYCAGIK